MLAVDPVDDDALRAKLDALSRLGRVDDARSAYRRFARRLVEELGVQPSAATRVFDEELASRGEAAAHTPARSATRRR